METIIIPVVGMMIPIIVVPTALFFKYARRVRELEHAERMRALELGVGPGAPGLNWPGAFVCGSIGAGVPIASFLVTWAASMTTEVDNGVWFAPVVASAFAIVAARKLAARMVEPKDRSTTESAKDGKPAYDPDAFDVVGSRG